MIKYVYATKNKLSGNFNTPLFYDFPVEAAAESFSITAKESPKEARLEELEVYYLGIYDTKSGEIKMDQQFIVDLGIVIYGEKQESK